MKRRPKSVLGEVARELLEVGAEFLKEYLKNELEARQRLLLEGAEQAATVVVDAREKLHEKARAVLGVSKEANLTVIKAAFRALSKEYHPDHGGNRDAFERVKAAYDVLVEAIEKRGK